MKRTCREKWECGGDESTEKKQTHVLSPGEKSNQMKMTEGTRASAVKNIGTSACWVNIRWVHTQHTHLHI